MSKLSQSLRKTPTAARLSAVNVPCERVGQSGTLVAQFSQSVSLIMAVPATKKNRSGTKYDAVTGPRVGANNIASGLPTGLSDADRYKAIPGLKEIGHPKVCRKGMVLFMEGAAARGLYLLASGRAKVSICSADGRKVIMRIAGPESILGLYAALTGRAYEATAEMLETGTVIFVSRQDLVKLIAGQGWFGSSLAEVFSYQFSELVDHARLLMLSESALERLARLILKWSRDFGEATGGGIRLQILLTQEEIAQIIGASRETVTRLFSALKRKQIIRKSGDVMIIRNSAALASMAQSPT